MTARRFSFVYTSVCCAFGLLSMVALTSPLLGAAGAPPAAVAPQADPQLDAAVAKVQAAYATFESFRADFTQTMRSGGLSKSRVDTGVVELKKGGKMHWEFKTPDARHFISDGKTLWIYSVADRQALSTPLAGNTSATALNFMAGLGELKRDFEVSLATEPEFRRVGTVALHLVPKESLGMVKRLTIVADAADGRVREAHLLDPMGTSTRMEFLNIQMNEKLEEARFTFKAPEGVTVIPAGNF